MPRFNDNHSDFGTLTVSVFIYNANKRIKKVAIVHKVHIDKVERDDVLAEFKQCNPHLDNSQLVAQWAPNAEEISL